jgi:hypothetical protein
MREVATGDRSCYIFIESRRRRFAQLSLFERLFESKEEKAKRRAAKDEAKRLESLYQTKRHFSLTVDDPVQSKNLGPIPSMSAAFIVKADREAVARLKCPHCETVGLQLNKKGVQPRAVVLEAKCLTCFSTFDITV